MKDMKLNKSQRHILSHKYNNKCAYCGCDLPERWHADHIEPCIRNRVWNSEKYDWVFDGTYENPENNNIDNFNPACPKCNINKHQMTIEQFRDSIKQYVESLNKYSVQYQMAKKYNLVNESEIDVKFYFETINSSK